MLEIFELKNVDILTIKELFDIHNSVFLQLDKLTFENFKNEFYLDNRIYFVAVLDDKIVGYIGVLNCIDFFEIIGIGVKLKNQNCGIGTKLLNEIFKKAKSFKINKIFLEVDSTNKNAKSFYEKNGFVVTNVRKNYYKNNDAFVMMCSNF